MHESVNALKEEWLTPPWLLAKLGPFDLDPCAPVNRPWDIAATHYTIFDNGLNRDWHGFVWLNPPYGRKCAAWLKKLAAHGNGLALITARTEVQWFSALWQHASAILFLGQRISFHHANGTKAASCLGVGSVIAAFGDEAVHRLRAAKLEGALVLEWLQV